MERPYAMLRGKIVQQGLTIKQLSAMMGFRTPYGLSLRFNGKTPWSVTEIYRVADLLGIPDKDIYTYFPRDGKKQTGGECK